MTTPPAKPTRRTAILRSCETLAIATAGGLAFGLPGLPAGWMSGAIVAASAAAFAGRPLHIPDRLARVVYVITGISLGGAVTPETVAGMGTWPASIAFLAAGMVALTIAVTAYLQIVHRWDRSSALLAAFPGGLATVIVLAVENNADVRAVAVVQTVRVAAVAVLLPMALAVVGLASVPAVSRAWVFDPYQLVLLVGISSAVALAAHWSRFPGGLMFGAMLASAVLHGTGFVTVGLPWWLAIMSFIVLGGLTGTRFGNTDIRTLRHLAAAAFGALLVGIGVAFAFAVVSAKVLSLDAGAMMIAYAPGAIDAMMIVALALNYDPAFVGAHHFARFVLVLGSMPWIVRFMQRGQKPPPDPPGPS